VRNYASSSNRSFAAAQTSKIKVLSISCTCLEIADVDYISYHLLKFPVLEDLDLSVNLSLDTDAINRMVAAFSG
jgi:hypothetical protein